MSRLASQDGRQVPSPNNDPTQDPKHLRAKAEYNVVQVNTIAGTASTTTHAASAFDPSTPTATSSPHQRLFFVAIVITSLQGDGILPVYSEEWGCTRVVNG